MKDETIIFKHSGAGTGFSGGLYRAWKCASDLLCDPDQPADGKIV